MFAGNDWSLPELSPLGTPLKGLAPSLAVEESESEKQSSLLQYIINCDRKKFNTLLVLLLHLFYTLTNIMTLIFKLKKTKVKLTQALDAVCYLRETTLG